MKPFRSLRRRAALSLAALALVGIDVGRALAAESWPTHPVRIIVPFAPGGGADSSARVLADVVGPQLGQPMVVDNKPGAGSAIGVMAAVQAKDGHTLLMGSNSMVINPLLNHAITYGVARDFDAIGMVSAQPLVLVVPASSPAKTVDELLSQARKGGAPLTAGNSGTGTLAHIASEIFAAQTGIAVTPVAYKGESALLPDLMAGRVALGFLNLPSVLAQIRAGRLHALAVSSPQPMPELPGVPTFRALKYPALEVQGWAALLAPKGSVPPEGLARLDTLLQQALRSEDVRKRFANIGVTPMVLGRAATAEFLQNEASRYAEVIKARGIKAE